MSQPKELSMMLSIDSQFQYTVMVAMAVRGLCSLTSFAEKEINRIELCIVEIVNNAIKHAYHEKKGNKVEVQIVITVQNEFMIHVVDYGTSMPLPLEEILAKKQASNKDPLDMLQCSGRGLCIVDQVMDHISYSSEDQKNCFTMYKQFH